MKMKSKIAMVTTAVAITSLMITAYLAEQQPPPNLPTNRPVSELVEVNKAYTPRTETKPIVAQEMPQISTQTEECTEPTPTETSPPQPTGILNRPLHQPQLHKRLQSKLLPQQPIHKLPKMAIFVS